jgi:hypothetical protein
VATGLCGGWTAEVVYLVVRRIRGRVVHLRAVHSHLAALDFGLLVHVLCMTTLPTTTSRISLG